MLRPNLYTEQEVTRLMQKNGLSSLPVREQVRILLGDESENKTILISYLRYHNIIEVVSALETALQDNANYRTKFSAAITLSLIGTEQAVTALISRLDRSVHSALESSFMRSQSWELDTYLEEALTLSDPATVVRVTSKQLESDTPLHIPRVESLLKYMYRLPPETVSDPVKHDIIRLLKRLAGATGYSSGHLLTWEDMNYTVKLLEGIPNKAHRVETIAALRTFDDTFASYRAMRMPITNLTGIDSLVFQLGVVQTYWNAPNSVAYSAPYERIGSELWEHSRKQVRDALCGETEAYTEERAKLKTYSEGGLVILIPIIMSALHLPPQAAGVAVVLSLMVIKMGINTLCKTAGDLRQLRGKPESVCRVSGRYVNLSEALVKDVSVGKKFPRTKDGSNWVFIEELNEDQ